MISYEQAIHMIKESLDNLHRTGLIDQTIEVNADTVLLGAGSRLDSIAFVAFVTELEDRLNDKTEEDIVLVLQEIHNSNVRNTYLDVDALARYISSKLTSEA